MIEQSNTIERKYKSIYFQNWAQPDWPLPYFDPKAGVMIVMFDLLSISQQKVGSLNFGAEEPLEII